MSITKTAAGTFRLEITYPKKVQKTLKGKRKFRQTFPTKRMAQLKEVEIRQKIIKAKQENSPLAFEVKGDILFSDFYKDVFMPMYLSGATGRTNIVPSEATVDFQKRVFRLQLLPFFGQYSLKYINSHKNLVLTELTLLSEHYAATRKITCYIQQLFDTVEALDYIEYNHVNSILRFVSEPKAKALKEAREKAGLSLTANELIDWLDAVDSDYQNGSLSLMDHLLFMLTLHIGDRKSESYALQWKHINLNTRTLYLVQTLSKFSKNKSTKSHKLSQLLIPKELITEISEWKKVQAQELSKLELTNHSSSFFSPIQNGHINIPLHPDYLNYRIKSIEKRHPQLVHLYPHKLRHTFGTLAREGGASVEDISDALTHTNISTTQIYINTPNFIQDTVHDMFTKRLSQARLTAKKQ